MNADDGDDDPKNADDGEYNGDDANDDRPGDVVLRLTAAVAASPDHVVAIDVVRPPRSYDAECVRRTRYGVGRRLIGDDGGGGDCAVDGRGGMVPGADTVGIVIGVLIM